MDVLRKVIAPGPGRRHRDTWRAWVPGLGIILGGVIAHSVGLIREEHILTLIVGIGSRKLPDNSRDDARHELAVNTRTDEHQRHHIPGPPEHQ